MSIKDSTPTPIRILELRCADGSGGGPEKTILLGAAQAEPERFAVTVCYIHNLHDTAFDVDARAKPLNIDFESVAQRHALDPAIWRQVRSLVRERQIDIIHAHDYKSNLLALMLARKERVIPLSTAHGYTGHSWRERLLYYPADKRLLARFPLVITVSSQLRRTLIRTGCSPERVIVVLNGIDHRQFRRDPSKRAEARVSLGIAPEDVVIGSIGRIELQKRYDVLVKAFAEILKQRPAARLLLAGEGNMRTEVESVAVKLGVIDRCDFLGYRSDVERIHHALDVFVQTSDYEGTANSVLEAMAFETPIVATDVGGTGELIRHGVDGLLVQPECPLETARAIESVLRDSSGTRLRVAAARERVETDLSFESRMRRVEDLYEKLATETRNLPHEHACGANADAESLV